MEKPLERAWSTLEIFYAAARARIKQGFYGNDELRALYPDALRTMIARPEQPLEISWRRVARPWHRGHKRTGPWLVYLPVHPVHDESEPR